ncbi:hypothetical protein BZG36_05265 [Bifiguratus adelaidae]|uniref:V-type proton ATPase subunit e n=1 Tax=Bifiguratus adelaidae TaxID=1938954 RepID=A0A261XTQ8_9FUNG|nr:hypothetical protein BZG36_05265 [Bifiguratus adelaidae]
MSGWNVVWGALVTGGLCAGSYFGAPRGENQTVIRTSLIMTLVCCYLMWAITYLAQLHPIINPKKSDFARNADTL